MMRDIQSLYSAGYSTMDNEEKSRVISFLIRQTQSPTQDNSTQEKHLERCRIAVEVNGLNV